MISLSPSKTWGRYKYNTSTNGSSHVVRELDRSLYLAALINVVVFLANYVVSGVAAPHCRRVGDYRQPISRFYVS